MTEAPTVRGFDEVREWIRHADDRAYVDHLLESSAASPRMRVGDVYGPLAEARARHPVHRGSHSVILGIEDFRTMKEIAERPIFALVGFDVVQAAFGDGETFSSRIHNETIGLVWGETLLGMDGTEHRLHRGLISQAFTKNAVTRWEHEIVAPVVAGLLDRFSADGGAELMTAFTALFPVYVIAAMLGLPQEDVPRFTGWAADTITVFHDRPRGLEASRLLAEYLEEKIDQRRAAPGDDLISVLIGAELDGRRLATSEIVNFCRLLLPAGAETTFRSSSSLLVALLRDQDALGAVRDDRSLVPAAIEEALRWEAPLTSVNRVATKDTELAGVAIPAGAIVECSMGGANRDPARWDDPDTYDLHRRPRPHVAFAHGPHTCIGMHLARMETRVALEALLDRLPNLHLDREAEPPEMRGLGFRQPTSIRVEF